MQINGSALRAIRERSGMNQVELAGAADVDRSHLSNLETGRRNAKPGVAKRLADALGVDISEIATFGDEAAEVAS